MHYESNLFAIIMLGVAALFLNAFGLRRYPYAINPLFQFAIFDIGLLTFLSAVVVNEINSGEINLLQCLILSIVYMAGFFVVFLSRRFRSPQQMFDGVLYLIGKNVNPAVYGAINQWFLLVLVFASFISLMWASGAGMLWLTEPRLAYQSYREGAGFIYVITQWTLLASLLYYLWVKRPKQFGLIIGVCAYSFAAYFTGSKANIFSGMVVVGIYYNFFIKKINASLLMFAAMFTLCVFLSLLLLQGSYDDIFSAISYFKDYVETTAGFLNRFDEFGLQWGYGALSELWFYVPRAIYPEKPFEYGVVLIHKVLFPGSAELGATPGVLPWALAYLDFGVLGVFFSGVFTGFIRRGAYESFLYNRDNILAFVLMMQLSLMPVFAYATLPLIFIIGITLFLFCRKKIVLF